MATATPAKATAARVPKKPIQKLCAKGITVSVWENEGKEGTTFKTVQIQRSYKDKEGNWKNTDIFRESDIPTLSALLQDTYSKMAITERA